MTSQDVTADTAAQPPAPLLAIRGQRDARLAAYLFVAVGALVVGLITGTPALIGVAAVIAPLLGIALLHSDPIVITGQLSMSHDRIVEGQSASLELTMRLPSWVTADLAVELPRGLLPGPPTERWSSDGEWRLFHHVERGARPAVVSMEFTGVEWGRHRPGPVLIEGQGPFGLIRWRASIEHELVLRVLPTPERLNELLAPAAARITHGSHRARRALGHGSEFAEIRQYQPGDRLRDLNWAATARRRTPHVNRHHPELAGEVVLYIDTANDRTTAMSSARRAALLRCASAAWAIAQLHLNAQDRVGLLASGSSTTWLDPRGGTRAKYQMLETLLSVNADDAAAQWLWARNPIDLIPGSALVVVLTPLWDPRLTAVIGRLHSRGRAVAVLVLDSDTVLPPARGRDQALSQELFDLSVHLRIEAIRRLGVPVMRWGADGVEAVIPALSRVGARRTVRGR